jgi:hypothetical protein
MRFVEVPSFENVADALRRQKSSSMRLHARLELYASEREIRELVRSISGSVEPATRSLQVLELVTSTPLLA